ncbi:MAG: restriction endonuclease subunit S [Propionivibrio sp.]|nr:restriction endonuclease subunit S [Propionivibrio sp.]
MAGEWKTASFGELTTNFDSRRKPVKEPDRRPGPYPYYGASGVVDYVDGYLFDGEYLLVAEDGENLRTRQTPIAFIAKGKFWVNNHAHIVTGNEKADTRFLMYALQNADISGYLTGAVMPKLTQGNLNRIELPHPPLPEQRAIAHILGTLDDKIELNRRRNQTLEAMARALFKDWFVDFGPVRAKMEGREPYLPTDLWQLFPDRLDDEGKPEGWEIAALDTLAALVTTSVSPWKSPETVFEHYSIPAYDAGRMPAMELGASIKSNKYVVDPNAVLVSKLNPQTPRIWLPDVATMNAICSTEFMQFVPHDRRNRPYLYCLMSSEAMQDEVLKHVTGSTGSRQRAQPSQIAKVDILKPHSDILKAFNLHVAPILNAAAGNQRESRTLAQLRDTLLPKLISGELRIADAEKFIEAAQ